MNKRLMSRYCAAGLLAISGIAYAEDWQDASGLLAAAGYDPNESKFMKDHNLKIGGWLNSSIGANMHSNSDGFNGPVTFNDRSGELQLNQLNVYLQKAINVNGDAFDIGGRVDVMYGTDSIFTQAYGSFGYDPGAALTASERSSWDLGLSGKGERFYGLAIPQAYAELNLPVGNGVAVKVGHFYTPIGYEVVTAPDNFFVTKPYTMQYGEPFTHTGFLATYAINPNWTVMGGGVTGSNSGGWDGGWDRDLGNWAWLGGVTWTSDDAGTSLAVTSTAGKRGESKDANDNWAMYSIVGKHNFTDKLHYIIQHDHGFADNIWTASGGASNPDAPAQNAEWYGINQYLIYDVTDKVSAGLRAEWFRDHNGIRVLGPGRCYAADANVGTTDQNFACGANYRANYGQEGSSYYAVTAGLSYKPAKWLNLRPNLRYDFTDNAKAFDNGTRHNQLLFTADVVVTF